jgi:hypothetical protein
MLKEITDNEIKFIFRKHKKTDSDSDQDAKKKQFNGLMIQAISDHQTIVSSIKLDASSFSKFNVKGEEMTFWVGITDLNKCLKDIETEGVNLKMRVPKDDPRVMILTVEDNEDDNRREEYTISFVESEVDIPDMKIHKDKIDFSLTMNTTLFKSICSKAKNFSRTIKISCYKDKIIFEYNINESSSKMNTISYGNNIEKGIKISLTERSKNKDNVSYFSSFVIDDLLNLKIPSNISNTMQLYMGSKQPLYISSQVVDNNEIIGQIYVYISPSDTDDVDNDKTNNLYKDSKAKMK